MSFQVIEGDCREVMATFAQASVDAIVCDPPYHLTTGKKGGTGPASANPNSPAGRARISTGFMGKSWDGGDVAFQPETWAAALRVARPGAHLVAFGGTRTYHRLTCAIEDAGWEIRDCLSWLYGSGFPKSLNIGEGRGTALKPAWEPIILARKRLATTVAKNVAGWGTGALNIDACRLTVAPGEIGDRVDDPARPARRPLNHMNDDRSFEKARNYREPSGRWPANVALDEEAARILDNQSGELKSGFMAAGTEREGLGYRGGLGIRVANDTHGDSGGASRFFYTAKASRSEREAGLDGHTVHTFVQGYSANPEASPDRDGDIGLNRPKRVRNNHPTVKPLDLMQWLCRLITPKAGLILDPFCGSGSTGRAAVAEGFSFIGIELDPEYAEIARARITDYAPLFHDPEAA